MISLQDFEVKYKGKNYIVFLPSGEVIYTSLSNIYDMLSQDLVETSQMMTYPDIFFAYDADRKTIVKFIDKSKIQKNEIVGFLLHCGLKHDNFLIYDDMSIDIYGSINMAYLDLIKIPYKFNRCSGDFICSYNKLLTIKNSPKYVGGKFDCSYNYIQTLVGGPDQVTTYLCNNNKLKNLEGSPKYVKFFNCSSNNIISYDDAPVVSSGGKIISTNNPVKYVEKI